MPFWPSLLWLLIMMYPLRKTVSNFFSAKAIGIIMILVIIPAVFYSYTAFTEEILVVDIATFMIAVIVGQVASYSLYKQANGSKRLGLGEVLAIAVIALLAMIFVTLTFYPPHLPIFMDSNTGRFGI